MTNFITDEKRAWMRLRDHAVVNERDPDFERFSKDPSGSILQILRIWASSTHTSTPVQGHYIGSVRHCECGGWVSSRRELNRLFHRATDAARLLGAETRGFRSDLSKLLRAHFSEPAEK